MSLIASIHVEPYQIVFVRMHLISVFPVAVLPDAVCFEDGRFWLFWSLSGKVSAVVLLF